jgi:dTDP-4-amino-4,6-dideoxygalactose transaminase
MMPDMPALVEMGLPVIEDASLAYGSTLAEKAAGSFGVLTILGLEERDMLTAGGGALLFAMEKRAASVLRGISTIPPELALSDMNAAMAIVQLREAAKNALRRKEIAEAYTRAALQSRHKLFAAPENFEYNNYAFPLLLETGVKDVQAYAKRKEIEVELAFAGITGGANGDGANSLPESASLSMRTALFPIYPRLSGKDIERVAKLIQSLP